MRLLAALLTAFASSKVVLGREIQASNINDYAILREEFLSLSYAQDITITSDFPVSSLLYNDNYYLSGGTPLRENDLNLVITSDCTEEELGGKPVITYKEGKESGVAGIDIRMGEDITADVDDLTFLETSTYQASWSYESFWCSTYQENGKPFDDDSEVTEINKSGGQQNHDKTKNQDGIPDDSMQQEMLVSNFPAAGRQKGLLFTAVALVFSLFLTGGSRQYSNFFWIAATSIAIIFTVLAVEDSNTTSTNSASPYNNTINTPICKINVELLHDGCRMNPLSVLAPTARYGKVVLQDRQSTGEECITYYEASLTFPQTTVFKEVTPDKHIRMPQVSPDRCFRVVEGRPFLDQTGQQIQAQATSDTNTLNGWCSAAATPDPTNPKPDSTANTRRSALGQEWTRRALGEHSSVSSFSAFTIALMSNNAPPDLVKDSLAAAADEVRHAKVSFQVASLLTGQTIEPSALPPSSHHFDGNLTKLALATAKEGCIDETLSAVLAASEVEELWGRPVEGVTEAEREHIREVMTTIALEEASHSALAWRTVAWVCKQDAQACRSVSESVFAPERLKEAVQERFLGHPLPLDRAEKLWGEIHSTLIPLVTGAKESGPSVRTADSTVLTDALVGKIVRGVSGAAKPTASAKTSQSVLQNT